MKPIPIVWHGDNNRLLQFKCKPLPPEGFELCGKEDGTMEAFLLQTFPGLNVWLWVEKDKDDKFNEAQYYIRPKAIITLEEGAWYEVEGGSVYQLKAPLTRPNGTTYALGPDYFYSRSGSPYMTSPRILRQVYVSDAPVAPEAFRLSGPGWYKAFHGQYRSVPYFSFIHVDDLLMSGFSSAGEPKHSGLPHLVARATPEQERVLEGL